MNEILKNYLLEVAPLGNEDDKVFSMCENDLQNYVKFLERKYPEDNSQAFYTYLRGKMLGEYWEEYSDEEMDKTMNLFVKDWCFIWWKKFKERTELALNKKDDIPKAALDIALKGRNILVAFWTREERNELEDYLMDIFYDAGEYCCTSILAHTLIEQYLGRDIWQEKKVFSNVDKLEFMHVVGTEARRMSQRKGKLLYIKPDLKKFLREWHDDTPSSVIG